jgi:hypothetical protein
MQEVGGRKIQIYSGGIPPDPPIIKCDTTPNFLLPTTICYLSAVSIVWSLFVDAPPPPTDEFLKNALECLNVF